MNTITNYYTTTHQGFHLKTVMNPVLFSYKNAISSFLEGMNNGKSKTSQRHLVRRITHTHNFMNTVAAAGFDFYHEDNQDLIVILEDVKALMPDLLKHGNIIKDKPLYFDSWG